jgi:hypothetical protein
METNEVVKYAIFWFISCGVIAVLWYFIRNTLGNVNIIEVDNTTKKTSKKVKNDGKRI